MYSTFFLNPLPLPSFTDLTRSAYKAKCPCQGLPPFPSRQSQLEGNVGW